MADKAYWSKARSECVPANMAWPMTRILRKATAGAEAAARQLCGSTVCSDVLVRCKIEKVFNGWWKRERRLPAGAVCGDTHGNRLELEFKSILWEPENG